MDKIERLRKLIELIALNVVSEPSLRQQEKCKTEALTLLDQLEQERYVPPIHRCFKKAVVERNGKPYCTIHDPEYVKKKDVECEAKYEANRCKKCSHHYPTHNGRRLKCLFSY